MFTKSIKITREGQEEFKCDRLVTHQLSPTFMNKKYKIDRLKKMELTGSYVRA